MGKSVVLKKLNLSEPPVYKEEEPVEPEITPEVEEVEVPEEPEQQDSCTFNLASYTPGQHETGLYPVVIFILVLIAALIAILFVRAHYSQSSSEAFNVPVSLDCDIADNYATLTITSPALKKPYIDIYKDGSLIEVDISKSGDSYKANLAESGSYLVHIIDVGHDINYGMQFIDVVLKSVYSELTTKVKDAVNQLQDPKKDQFLPAIKNVWLEAAKGTFDDTTISGITDKNDTILGFNDNEQKTAYEHEWYEILGYNGVIDKYLTSNNIVINKDNYKQIFTAIAEGL